MSDRPHHHGNLRAALIDAALAILDEGGVEALTLRKAAARAGVSHAAPAHHFNGKHGLVVALAAHGFRTFTDLMEEERLRHGKDPQAQLLGICEGYIRFSREQRALFQLIFRTDFRKDVSDELREASAAAYGLLAEVCALFEPSPNGPGVNEVMVWSLVHGYASLSQQRQGSAWPSGRAIGFEDILPALTPRD